MRGVTTNAHAVKVISIVGVSLAAACVAAQPPPEQVQTVSSPVYEEVLKVFLSTLAGALAGYFISIATWARKKAAAFANEIVASMYQPGPRSLAPGERECVSLVVGLGRVGKTSLIYDLVSEPETDPRVTLEFEIYSGTSRSTVGENDSDQSRLILTDYRGQDTSQLVASFVLAQLDADTPIRYGNVDSLILVVSARRFKGECRVPWSLVRVLPEDAKRVIGGAKPGDVREGEPFVRVAPETVRDLANRGLLTRDQAKELQRGLIDQNADASFDSMDAEYINEQNAEWNKTALDALFGLLTVDLKYVCLWINKSDQSGDSSTKHTELTAAFGPLVQALRGRCNDLTAAAGRQVKFDVIAGSTSDRRADVEDHTRRPDVNVTRLRKALLKVARSGT